MTPYWGKVIDEALRREAHGDEPFEPRHQHDSAGWTTCACGKQDPRLHDKNGAPWDEELETLGDDFHSAIHDQDPERASDVLALIEFRAATLLDQIRDSGPDEGPCDDCGHPAHYLDPDGRLRCADCSAFTDGLS